MKIKYSVILFVLIFFHAFSQEHPEDYAYRSHTFEDKTIPYRLFVPREYDENQVYPLVTALHGIYDRGDDNEHIDGSRLVFSWSDSINQANWPCLVVAPQCPEFARWYPYNERSDEFAIWEIVNNMLDSLIVEFPIDTNRLYITGLSLGGYGTWHLLAEYPDKFAAAVPVCGGGEPELVTNYLQMPIWNFHGDADDVVPVKASRVMIDALIKNGRACVYTYCNNGDCSGLTDEEIQQALENDAKLLYTEWEDGPHEIWDQSYDYPYLFPWVFSQSKDPEFVFVLQSDKVQNDKFILKQNYPNPFNPQTTIQFSLKQSGHVRLEIYNVSGQKVDVLIDEFLSEGSFDVTWQSKGLPSGLYFYQLTVDGYSITKKLLLNK